MPYRIHIKLTTPDDKTAEQRDELREELRDTAEILVGYREAVRKYYAVPAGERDVATYQLLDRWTSKVDHWINKHKIIIK